MEVSSKPLKIVVCINLRFITIYLLISIFKLDEAINNWLFNSNFAKEVTLQDSKRKNNRQMKLYSNFLVFALFLKSL